MNRDPTAQADAIAAEMRAYYEANREGFWERLKRRSDQADNLMLGLLNIDIQRMPPRERTDENG